MSGAATVVRRARALEDVFDEHDLRIITVVEPVHAAVTPEAFAPLTYQVIWRDIVDYCSICGKYYANDPNSHKCPRR